MFDNLPEFSLRDGRVFVTSGVGLDPLEDDIVLPALVELPELLRQVLDVLLQVLDPGGRVGRLGAQVAHPGLDGRPQTGNFFFQLFCRFFLSSLLVFC